MKQRQRRKNGSRTGQNQVRRHGPSLVMHNDGALSLRDSNSHWHRRLSQISQDLFFGLSQRQREKIVIAEACYHRLLVEGNRRPPFWERAFPHPASWEEK